MIEELETRRQAGLPIQVVVRVEKITPSMPEYCQIIPEFCHLEVIKEETSASDEDPKKEIDERSEKNIKTYDLKKIPDDNECSDFDEKNNRITGSSSEIELNETFTSDCHLERLESPSLVRKSVNLRFADIIITENESVTELITHEPLNNFSSDVNNIVENSECIEREAWDISSDNSLSGKLKSDYSAEDVENCENPIENENVKIQKTNGSNDTDYSLEQNRSITNTSLSTIESCDEDNSYEEVNYQENLIEVTCKAKQNGVFEDLTENTQFIDCSDSTVEPSRNTNMNKYNSFSKIEHNVKTFDVPCQDNAENDESSDDSTIKQCDTYNHKYKKTRNQNNDFSIYDKLRQIARLLRDDTDDYDEVQSSRTTPRCVSIASDADVDTDWVSFTLSDGESSKSLCLSPSQLKSGHAPSTVSDTSEIINLHKKFLNRTRSPNFSPHQHITPVDILGYSDSPSPSPSKSYSTEVIDEACRMCGTSDEPLSDAECLVSLRKYRETRSRLLEVIQKERQLNRSVIDQPSAMPMYIDTLSVPDNHTRELMYTEYMEKVKERENRLNNKVIRITKAYRPLSSGSLQSLNDIDAEFVSKARERLEKLGVEADVQIEVKEEYYPKHLVDIVPEEEVCIEEVHMNGESSGLGVRVCVYVFVLFCFTNTVFAVWPSLITLLRYESAEEVSKISSKCPSLRTP